MKQVLPQLGDIIQILDGVWEHRLGMVTHAGRDDYKVYWFDVKLTHSFTTMTVMGCLEHRPDYRKWRIAA